MRVILLILGIVTVLYAYAWQMSRETLKYTIPPQSVYSDRGAMSDEEGGPC
jgi:hypothetical protein